jgi:hypothetical protein
MPLHQKEEHLHLFPCFHVSITQDTDQHLVS